MFTQPSRANKQIHTNTGMNKHCTRLESELNQNRVFKGKDTTRPDISYLIDDATM